MSDTSLGHTPRAHAVATGEPRPATVCAWLLQALGASDGRRKRRKRDTTPDAIGMALKRDLLAAAVAADPDPEAFEAWLFARVQASGRASGATRAMALQIHDEWQFALHSGGFRDWLAAGAPSDDIVKGGEEERRGAKGGERGAKEIEGDGVTEPDE
jgi:hypothetical protein